MAVTRYADALMQEFERDSRLNTCAPPRDRPAGAAAPRGPSAPSWRPGHNPDDHPAWTEPMNAPATPTIENPHIDKQGAELDHQRFQMLQDIAKELSGDTVFPTCFETVIQLRKALQDPEISIGRLAALITLDPLVSARLLALANSAAYNPAGSPIRDLHHAITRLGLHTVRTATFAIAMKQLLMARGVVGFHNLADQLWRHSLHTASAAYVLARRLTRISPDEALLAGIIHDIGAFYMIYRASLYEELVLRPETTQYLIVRWHESIGHALIIALGLPAELADAMRDHDQPRSIPASPRTLADVVFLANRLAGGISGWLGHQPSEVPVAGQEHIAALNEQFDEEIRAHEASLLAAFA